VFDCLVSHIHHCIFVLYVIDDTRIQYHCDTSNIFFLLSGYLPIYLFLQVFLNYNTFSQRENVNFKWINHIKSIFDNVGLSYVWNQQNPIHLVELKLFKGLISNFFRFMKK
jgi:hypothetical protein